MKKPHVSSLNASPKRGRRLAPALLLTAFLSCTTEVVGPQIGTELVLATSAAGAVNGVPFATAPSVHIVDEQGNTVTDANFPVTLTVSSGATVIGSSTVSAVDGIAVFNTAGLTGPAGTYTLTYTATLAVGPRTVSQSITLAPGAAARYIVTPSTSSATVGTPVTINAQLVDANDSPISAAGRVVTWTVAGQNGSFSAATSQTDASGRATVSYTADTVDSKTATITATDNSSITGSTNVTTVAGPAAKLAFNVQPSNTGTRVIIQPPVIVTIQDRYSNTVIAGAPAVTLSIASNPGGATITGGGPTAASGGIATFPEVMLDQPGSGYTLTASSPGLTSATSATFDVSSISVIAKVAASRSLTVFGSSVYFTDCSATLNDGFGQQCNVSAVAKTGGAVTPLGPRSPLIEYGGRLIADGTYINVLQVSGANLRSTAIIRGPIAGGPGTTLAAPAPRAAGGPDMEYDGTNFYSSWTPSLGDGSYGIGRSRVSDGSTQILVLGVAYFTVAGGQIYYFDGTAAGLTIQKMSVDSGVSTTVVTGLGPPPNTAYPWRRILVVENTIYWVERDGSLRSAPISGGVPTTRATGVDGNLVSDGTYIYASGGSSILRFRLSDFSATTIATNESVVDIALDSQAVYWATRDGFIKKAPK